MTEVIVWSGWVGGIAVGCYGLAQYYLTGNLLGTSTGYGNICGLVSKSPFFKKGTYATANNWRLWFIVGLPIGGFLGALTSPGEIALSFSVGAMYDTVLPQALWAKGAILAMGGILIGYGSRMADGCTSGHAITGVALLNWPSIVAAAGFFAGGVIMVQILFRMLS